MSLGGSSRHRSQPSLGKVSAGKLSSGGRRTPPPPTLTPENSDAPFEPCAATASFLLYAQRNRILVLHHDTLAIERRFDLHREDVLWIAVDNVSEKGSGRLAVSYDAGSTAIVWDILSGAEVARFSAYEHIKVATFMRNGNIAFGNDQGNIILFEPSTSEHISARTIFDPITAIAPSADCLTFAIGYLNGSILIATLQPTFTILYTLTTTRAPCRITGLAWHGSSSKQKTDMLATQTLDSDLRVWSVPKPPLRETPTIIRVLQRSDFQQPGACWFAWSKNGRIVQYAEGETRSWDVRTKKVSYEVVPTVEGVVGVACYGPAAKMFTLTRNHGVQQYDINPSGVPAQVASVQHMPANTPPTPPTTFDERKDPYENSRSMDEVATLPNASETEESSTDEAGGRSPLQRIAMEMESLDALQDELRDKVMPLSPTSSRTSSVSSRSSGRRSRGRRYLYDRPDSNSSSRAPSSVGQQTEFSLGTPSLKLGHDSMSIRSVSSLHSTPRFRTTSSLRNQLLRSPEDVRNSAALDLFPHTRARIKEVPFRPPHYGDVARTPDLLQREMLSVLFGWNDTSRSLIRDELQRHKGGSAAAVLLSKWLGDMSVDHMASMVGSDSMTSADWMMLALSSIGQDSQKKVGEAFVQRLLEKGDIHPAVAILVGLGENNDAIEVYVEQRYWLEAVLLTCLTCPSDWQRISHLVREWGASAVQQGQSDLAVRCFSCTSIETSEPWFSPRAQDAAYTAQQERLTGPPSAGPLTSPPLSPPSRSGSQRLTQKNASLKLITTFGDKGAPLLSTTDVATPMNAMGVTPIAQSAMPFSALSPGGQQPWQQPRSFNMREPASPRTATPGAVTKKRLPSKGDIERVKQEATTIATPITAAREIPPPLASRHARRTPSLSTSTNDPATAIKPTLSAETLGTGMNPTDDHLPSTSAGAFTRTRGDSHARRKLSQDQKSDNLAVQIIDTRYEDDSSVNTPASRAGARSGMSSRSGASRSIDDYLNSIEEAKEQARENRERSRRRDESRKRDGSRAGRGASRPRELSETRGLNNVRYIKPAKRSPSSPVPMSPEEIAQANQAAKQKPEPATSEDESFYKLASPVESHRSLKSFRSEPAQRQRKRGSPERRPRSDTLDDTSPSKNTEGRDRDLIADPARGRTDQRKPGSTARSPSSPLPMPVEVPSVASQTDANRDGPRMRLRADSHTGGDLQARRAESRDRRDRSSSRKPTEKEEIIMGMPSSDVSKVSIPEDALAGSILSSTTSESGHRARTNQRREYAQNQLEERRRSLARRPSAPSFPLPGEVTFRPHMAYTSTAELGDGPPSYNDPLARSRTVDPDSMSRHGKLGGTSMTSASIGLPATPRAMRHPKYMSTDPTERDAAPPVPEIPENASNLSSPGSSLSQVSYSNLDSIAPSHLTSNLTSNMASNLTSSASYLTSNVSNDSWSALSSQVSSNPYIYEEDSVAPLLPSTVFGQKGTQAPYARAASAPPEKSFGGVHPAYKSSLQPSSRPSHVRKIQPPNAQNDRLPSVASIDEALAGSDDQVVVIGDDSLDPPTLPELQHLAGPPPPPPPPKIPVPPQHGQVDSSGTINIAIEDYAPGAAVEVASMLPSTTYSTLPTTTYPQPMERATTASPAVQRRGRGSVSETFGSRFRDLGDKMRSTSRNRTKLPADYRPSPYETVLPPVPPQHQRHESVSRAKSPYEQAMDAQSNYQPRFPPPPPMTLPAGRLEETTIPPSTLPRSQSSQGYRNPKDIRANMPPDTLQQGVYQGPGGYL